MDFRFCSVETMPVSSLGIEVMKCIYHVIKELVFYKARVWNEASEHTVSLTMWREFCSLLLAVDLLLKKKNLLNEGPLDSIVQFFLWMSLKQMSCEVSFSVWRKYEYESLNERVAGRCGREQYVNKITGKGRSISVCVWGLSCLS